MVNKSGGNVQLQNLNVYGGSTFSIDAGDSLTDSAEVDGAGSVLDLNQAVSLANYLFITNGATVNTASTLDLNTGYHGLQLSNGTFHAGGDVTVSNSFYGVGVSGGSTFDLGGHTLTADSLYLGYSAYFGNPGLATFTRGPGGDVQLGSLYVYAGNSFSIEAGDSVANSIDVRDAGSTLDLNGQSITTSSTILSSQGQLVGSGTVVGTVNNASGIVAPGPSAAVLTITGSYLQTYGTLAIELGGTDNSNPLDPEFDQIVVDGVASPGGLLDVSLIDAFAPSVGDSFSIITTTAGVASGFGNVLLPELDGAATWRIGGGPIDVTLFVGPDLTGDYNGDGTVNAADYTVWRNTLGQQVTAGQLADGDGSGFVDDGDYAIWKAHFGEVFGGGDGALSEASNAVPEPGAAVLALVGLVGLACRRRRAPEPDALLQ